MSFVRTIRGDIDPKDLGPTTAHDHLIRIGGGEVIADAEHLLDSVDKAVEEASYFMKAGGKSVIDMCPIDMGRDVRKLKEVNDRLPELNIVVTTGFHKGELYKDNRTHWVNRYRVDQITELIIADITEGIDVHDYSGPIVERSPVRAGVIKIGTGYAAITAFEEKFIEAVAAASAETGAPVNTHTQHGTMSLEQAQLLIKHGAKPENITIGHIQRNYDVYYQSQVCELGVNLMYDGPYRIKYVPDSVRIQLIKDMVKAGWADRITLGTDSGKRSYQKAYGGGSGIDYDLLVTRPRMLAEGMDPDVVDAFFVANPARAFMFKP
jgi:phosphotriesterase-related protein